MARRFVEVVRVVEIDEDGAVVGGEKLLLERRPQRVVFTVSGAAPRAPLADGRMGCVRSCTGCAPRVDAANVSTSARGTGVARVEGEMALAKRATGLKWALLLIGTGLALGSFVSLDPAFTVAASTPAPTMNLEAFSAERPTRPLRLLFIHHSIGGQLLAERGPERERASCILESHPNGGGLRAKLQAQGYEVHEASYGSDVGDRTDLFDWKPTFATKMDKLLAVDENDRPLAQAKTIDVVMFKSCFPNSHFVANGEPPGNASGRDLTVWNAKAALSSLLDEFAKRPKTLFVYVTAPPAAPTGAGPALKVLAKRLLGRIPSKEEALEQGRLARAFNTWVVSPEGWLAGYPLKNVVVYDFYDALTDHGKSNHLRYPSGDGSDPHPTSEGNAKAGEGLPAFVNRATRRAGLSD